MSGALPGPGGFAWMTGIEDTCVHPPARYSMPALDEFALTGHDRHWADDLRLARDLGATGIRYGIGWPRVHVARGRFEWGDLDERLGLADELGLAVVADLVHYGTPTWLEGSFADPAYPDAVIEYTAAVASRYRGLLAGLTPLNEPVTTASFAGLRGVWPPALRGWEGWTRVAVPIAEGITGSIRAAREADPGLAIVHVEASTLYEHADDPALADHARTLEMVGWLTTDLVLGRVTSEHPGWRWLLDNGASFAALDRLRSSPATIDVLGVNYYPDLTPRVLRADTIDAHQDAVYRGADGLETVLRAAADRYRLPMMITETSIEGDEEVRSAWLRSSSDAVTRLRADGIDLRGYTWWPLLDFVDWSWASGGRNVEEFAIDPAVETARRASRAVPGGRGPVEPFLRRMGVVRLDEVRGDLERHPDAAATTFARLAGARELQP